MSVNIAERGGPVVKQGYLRKLKTSKKRFFVLRAETSDSSARLEYYESEKKFNSGQAPKRSIPIKTCFNINKRNDTKYKHVIALYTRLDSFCVVLDTEEDLDSWLKALLSQQQGLEEEVDGNMPRPTFEHIWQVKLLNRGVTQMVPGYRQNEHSMAHRLCLTDKTLSIIRQDCEDSQADFPLSILRSCGSLKHYFYLEAGRSSIIGAGEIWMEAEDPNIAQNINRTVYNAMLNSSSSREELGPKTRNRSSSATESSKPTSVHRRQTMASGTLKPIPIPSHQQQQHQQQQDQIINNTNTEISATPCTSNNNNTVTAGGNIAWPGIIVNHQRTRSLPLAHPAPITTDNPLHPPRAAKRSTQSSKCFSDTRGRCASMPMPSRPRTTSEGNHPIVFLERLPWINHHKHSNRDISHSPPSDSPLSPHSGACSTDSAGSSLSIDDSENWHEADVHRGRFPLSLTPDEAIAEENCDDCPDSPCRHHISPSHGSYVPMAPISSDDGYVDMSPRGRHTAMSPAASMSSVTSGTPSTDMRFSEFPLEKVISLIPSEEEETSSAERPRTYSMGSKPFRNRLEQPRNRACSLGSKSKKGYMVRVLPPHVSQAHHNGAKSSSAPILNNGRPHSSHSSIGPMDDLMELDFSKKITSESPSSGYMNMKPGNNKVPFGYVEMRPGHIEKPPADTTPYVDMRPGSSPAKGSDTPKSDYMDMEGSKNRNINNNNHLSSSTQSKPSSSPMSQPTLSPSLSSVPSTSPIIPYTPTTDYIAMNFQAKSQSTEQYSSSPARSIMGHPWHSIEYIDLYSSHPLADPTNRQQQQQTSEGYMEMSTATGKPTTISLKPPTTTSSSSGGSSTAGDYTNMNMGSAKKATEKTRRSKPINIQSSRNIINDTLSRGRMFLPLSRPRSRKNSRRDSKDSAGSSATTPKLETIFPLSLNSPNSPVETTARSTATHWSGNNSNSSGTNNTTIRNEDYTLMEYEPKTAPQADLDYVNFQPGLTHQVAALRLHEDNGFRPIDEEASSKQSGPSSESSEMSTIVGAGSRPESANSVLLQHESSGLHYASLDLAPADEDGGAPPRPKSDATTDSFAAYAEIDFERSQNNQAHTAAATAAAADAAN